MNEKRTYHKLLINICLRVRSQVQLQQKGYLGITFLRAHENASQILSQCIKICHSSYEPHLYHLFSLILILRPLLNLGY